MKFDDLKTIWQQASQQEVESKELSSSEILSLLKKKTWGIVEKLDLNIRLGFLILFLMLGYLFVDYFVFSPFLLKRIPLHISYYEQLELLDLFVYVIALVCFIVFWVSYRKIDTKNITVLNLKESILHIVGALNLFRKLFYLTLGLFLVCSAVDFFAGLRTGLELGLSMHGLSLARMTLSFFIFAYAFGTIVLALIVFGYYALVNWVFNRLYGQYLKKLKATLAELEEKIE